MVKYRPLSVATRVPPDHTMLLSEYAAVAPRPPLLSVPLFLKAPATTQLYTLSLNDALLSLP